MEVTLTFHCDYCGEEIGSEVKNGAVYDYETHDCIGEQFGFIADISGEKLITSENVTVEFNPN